jgi:hypothetical protein
MRTGLLGLRRRANLHLILLQDTSGPALNIVMKLMAVLSLVFADTFYAINGGQGLFKL